MNTAELTFTDSLRRIRGAKNGPRPGSIRWRNRSKLNGKPCEEAVEKMNDPFPSITIVAAYSP